MLAISERQLETEARARYEWSLPIEEDQLEIQAELPTTCGQCALFFASRVMPGWGCCKRTEETRRSLALACPTGEIDCPF